MKEAIGLSWIFVICLTFIILFTGYIAISVNYNKAFQIKDYVISKIEENPGGYTKDKKFDDGINAYLTAQGYTTYGECLPKIKETSLEGDPETTTEWSLAGCLGYHPTNVDNQCGVCIYEKTINDAALDDFSADKSYYKVVSFFKFDLPVVNVLLNFKISGTSKYIVTDK